MLDDHQTIVRRVYEYVDGWKIRAVTLNEFWRPGNRHIMQLAAELGARKLPEGA